MKRLGILTTCALLAACGGGSGTRSNAAATKTFSYSAPGPASYAQATALDTQVAGAAALNGSLSTSTAPSATGMADFSGATGALLGSSPVARVAVPASIAAPLPRLALATAAALPSCVTVTASGTAATITFAGCVETSTATSTDPVTGVTTSSTTKVTIDGTVHSPAPGSLDWDLTVGLSMTDTQGTSVSARSHQHGDLAVTATTIKGTMLSEASLAASSSGVAFSAAVDESLTVDVTYTAGPPECVTGGTLEAKRVWVQRPQGQTASTLPDQGAKVTWTGTCGSADIQTSP